MKKKLIILLVATVVINQAYAMRSRPLKKRKVSDKKFVIVEAEEPIEGDRKRKHSGYTLECESSSSSSVTTPEIILKTVEGKKICFKGNDIEAWKESQVILNLLTDSDPKGSIKIPLKVIDVKRILPFLKIINSIDNDNVVKITNDLTIRLIASALYYVCELLIIADYLDVPLLQHYCIKVLAYKCMWIRNYAMYKSYLENIPQGLSCKIASGIMNKHPVVDELLSETIIKTERLKHSNRVVCVAFSSDSRQMVSGGEERVIRLWGLTGDGWKSKKIFQGHTQDVESIQFKNNKEFISGSQDNTIRIWNIKNNNCKKVLNHLDRVWWISKHPVNEDNILVAGKVYDTKKGLITSLDIETDEDIWCQAFTMDGKYIVTGGTDRIIKIWDLKTTKCIKRLSGHKKVVMGLVCSPDGRYIVSGSFDKTIRFWDLATGKCVKVLNTDREVTNLTFSPKGEFLIATLINGEAPIWHVKTGNNIIILDGHEQKPVWGVSWSPNGQFIATGGYDNSVVIWDVSELFSLKKYLEKDLLLPQALLVQKMIESPDLGVPTALKEWFYTLNKDVQKMLRNKGTQ